MASQEQSLPHLISEVLRSMSLMLPDGWLPVARSGGIHVGYMAYPQSFTIQRPLFVLPCGKISIEVHGKTLPRQHELWLCMKRMSLNQSSVGKFSDHIFSMIYLLCSFEICSGADAYEDLCKNDSNSVVDDNRYSDNRYSKICRDDRCLMLVSAFRFKRCKSCRKLLSTFCDSCQLKSKQTPIQSTLNAMRPHACSFPPKAKIWFRRDLFGTEFSS